MGSWCMLGSVAPVLGELVRQQPRCRSQDQFGSRFRRCRSVVMEIAISVMWATGCVSASTD